MALTPVTDIEKQLVASIALERQKRGLTAPEVEKVLLEGDLSKLSEEQRLNYYQAVCQSVGLNPLTQPFEYIRLNGKLKLYAKKDATDQLRKLHKVSIEGVDATKLDDVYVVTAYAQDASGRKDTSTGAVPIGNLKGDSLANALMKAETKAKRRVTLSICGLGMLDETEIESIHNREPLIVRPVEQPQLTEAESEPAPEGTVRIEHIQPFRGGSTARLLLSDGREVWANSPELVKVLEQRCQDRMAIYVETEHKTRVRGKDKGQPFEEIIEIKTWTDEVVEPETAPAPQDEIPFGPMR